MFLVLALLFLLVALVVGTRSETPDGTHREMIAGTDAIVKDGVQTGVIDSRMIVAVNAARQAGLRPVITSAHRPGDRGSLHRTGRALDFRSRHLEAQEKQNVTTAMQERLGKEWDVLHEPSPAPHFHVEYDPGQ